MICEHAYIFLFCSWWNGGITSICGYELLAIIFHSFYFLSNKKPHYDGPSNFRSECVTLCNTTRLVGENL